MEFDAFIDKDITVHTTSGKSHRGVLKVICGDESLRFDVEYDTFYIKTDVVYAVTVHGNQKTNVYSP